MNNVKHQMFIQKINSLRGLSKSENDAYWLIYEGLKKLDNSITISLTNKNRIGQIMEYVTTDTPEFLYVNPAQFRYRSSFTASEIYPEYFFAPNEAEQKIREFMNECCMIVNNVVNRSMSDYEKTDEIYKFVCNNFKYGTVRNDTDGVVMGQSQYYTLFSRIGLCKGLSLLFRSLLYIADVDSLSISGTLCHDGKNRESHAWTMVQIGNKLVHIDIVGECYSKQSSHGFSYFQFGLTDYEMLSTGMYSWNKKEYPDSSPSGISPYQKYGMVSNEAELKNVFLKDKFNKYYYIQFDKKYPYAFKTMDEAGNYIINYMSNNNLRSFRNIYYGYEENRRLLYLEIN